MSSIGAFRLIALSCLNHLQNNEAGVCRSDEPEFVHQARVAIRRLRSAIRLWQPLLPEDFVARFDPLWQELAANWVIPATGMSSLRKPCPHCRRPARQGRGRAAVEPCPETLREQSQGQQKRAQVGSVFAPVDRLQCRHPVPAGRCRRVARTLRPALPRQARQARRGSRRGCARNDDAARHRLRVAFKQLRYAVEFFTPILAGPVLANYHQSASDLQDCSDVSTTWRWLRNLSPRRQPLAGARGLQTGWQPRPIRYCPNLPGDSTIFSNSRYPGKQGNDSFAPEGNGREAGALPWVVAVWLCRQRMGRRWDDVGTTLPDDAGAVRQEDGSATACKSSWRSQSS
jgi:CHAD domain-containing protein